MTTDNQNYLLRVKAILITIGVIKWECILDSDSWLQYKEEGYSPIGAVKEDFDGYIIPFVRWSYVSENLKQLKK